MTRSVLTPNGRMLTRGSRAKLRCVNLGDNENLWDRFWNSAWSPTEIELQFSFYSSLGVNCIKTYCDGLPSLSTGGNGADYGLGFPTDSVLLSRIQMYLTLCRKYNLSIYLAFNQNIEFGSTTPATQTARIAVIQKCLQWFVTYGSDVVVAVDLVNEMNGVNAQTLWGSNFNVTTAARLAMAELVTMARTTCNFPLTASVLIGNKAQLGNHPFLDFQYDLGLDFHDYHPYYGFDPRNGPIPAGSDVSAIRGRAKYIGRVMLGECGCGGDGAAPHQPGDQARWVNGMGDAARDRDAFGANWFTSRPYSQIGKPFSDGPGTYAIYNIALSVTNSNITDNMRRWPAIG